MPYIKQVQRKELSEDLLSLTKKLKQRGEYNYVITSLLHDYVKKNGLKYDTLNDAQGIIECVAKEFYRTVVSPYEDIKVTENGNISELDNVC